MDDQQQLSRQKRIRSIINFIQGIATTLFVIAVIIVIYLTIIYRARVIPFTNYAIVFDAGSSHTEMFVYHWPADKSDGLGTTSSVNEFFTCPVAAVYAGESKKKGEAIKLKAISDFEQHLDQLHDYFKPCLQKAMSQIPSNRQKFAPVFLGATAGMRLSRLRNATRANQVFETIRDIFSRYPFQFVAARQVRILTGMEEAIDGWITTNILLEKFKHRHAKKKQMDSSVGPDELDPDMVGVLDLGGASTQVTFTYKATADDEPIPAEFTTNITLFDSVYSPYAHSYLCWGKNEALRRYRARLINAAVNNNRTFAPATTRILIRDPCLASGANDSLTAANIFRSPCTMNEHQQFNNNANVTLFTFVGVGNAAQCRQRLTSLFDAKRNDKTVNCTFKQEYCTFDHTFQPNLPSKINFIGLSGYYYVFDNLAHGMTKPSEATKERYKLKDFSLEEINQRLVSVCETNYPRLYEQESMTSSNEIHKRALCFDAWYMWLLLTYAIGFKDSDLKRLSFANTFPTGKVGWTLGYMINQTNYIPAEFREKPIGKNQYFSWVTISLIIVLVTLIFLILTCHTYIRHAYYKRTRQRTTVTRDGYAQPHEQPLA
ncbi:unnamed protein product [Adineta steineri]|uniref:Uncharacterized protein n=1 Tax=Adineta steineri TaxID=433720 RepID=A0A818XHM2_9BILA|nr:unnamed protein product [Adineta steineri]CAF3739371.1 unnamed protein product [Adineta steineri]